MLDKIIIRNGASAPTYMAYEELRAWYHKFTAKMVLLLVSIKEDKDKSKEKYAFKIKGTQIQIICSRAVLKQLVRDGEFIIPAFKLSVDDRLLYTPEKQIMPSQPNVAKTSAEVTLKDKVDAWYAELEQKCKLTGAPFKKDEIVIEGNRVTLIRANTVINNVYIIPPFITDLRKLPDAFTNVEWTEDDDGKRYRVRKPHIFSQYDRLTVINRSEYLVDMTGLFAFACIDSLDIRQLNASKVTNMQGMFVQACIGECLGISEIDVSHVTDMSYMFCLAYFKDLDLNTWNVSNVRNMRKMFNSAYINSLLVTNWNVANVVDMSYMFCNCGAYLGSDFNGWDTGNVVTMKGMFAHLGKVDFRKISAWNTSKVTDMSYMFYGCNRMYKEGNVMDELSSWSFARVHTMKHMFGLDDYANSDSVFYFEVYLGKFNAPFLSDMSGFDGPYILADTINTPALKTRPRNFMTVTEKKEKEKREEAERNAEIDRYNELQEQWRHNDSFYNDFDEEEETEEPDDDEYDY